MNEITEKIRVVSSALTIIEDPEQIELAKNNELWHNGKRILVAKGQQAKEFLR